MPNIHMPSPSPEFCLYHKAFQEFIQKDFPKEVPEWLLMAAGLHMAYRTLQQSEALGLMFDAENQFDLSMLRWCIETENRSTGRTRLPKSENAAN